MKIYSDDSRLLDAIHDDFFKQKIEVEKISKELDTQSDKVPMGGIETAVLILGSAASLATLHDYFERRVPEWIIQIKGVIFGEKIDVTFEEYEKLSDEAKKALSDNDFEVHIKKR